MSVFYNDNDARACAALREMMAAGLIGEGNVDERDIATIRPRELVGYDRVHLFAGIGGFELAARLAGWPEGVQLWTGGFPCQPFSVAGRRGGTADNRYLWPEFHRLIAGCRPEFVVIENVSAIDAEPDLVLDRVCLDLEAIGYEVAPPLEIPACAVDAAHERNRVWIMAHRDESRPQERGGVGSHDGAQRPAAERGGAGDLCYADDQRQLQPQGGICGERRLAGDADQWGDISWIACHDGKFRRLPLGLLDPSRVLADELPSRTVALHGLGNSIVPQVAAKVLRAMLDAAGQGAAGLGPGKARIIDDA